MMLVPFIYFTSLVKDVYWGGWEVRFIFAIKANDYDDRDTKSTYDDADGMRQGEEGDGATYERGGEANAYT